MHCPLCSSTQCEPFVVADEKSYWRCSQCSLRFMESSSHLSTEEEFAHYHSHENDIDDPQYRAFLNRIYAPLKSLLNPASVGLDYGCGPGPALAQMLSEIGHQMALYDPYFYPDIKVLDQTYDFICCTETVEHFNRPAEEFRKLDQMLRSGGWLAIMTCFQNDDARFGNWHYRRDPTHVMFYRAETFAWIADKFGWNLEIPQKDVVLLRKND